MVKGENDGTYLKLKECFDKLLGIQNVTGTKKIKSSQYKNIVDLILDIGLEEAMKNYKR
jgi:hypothetical protein